MYDSPCQRRGKCDAGVHARRKSADLHQGVPQDILGRHDREASHAAHADSRTRQAFVDQLLARTAESRNLMCAWATIAATSGDTPGKDGMRCSDLDLPKAWELLRTVSKALQHGTYRTAPDRELEIPKSSGNGTRKLHIPTVVDRTVQRALVQTLQPYLESAFDEDSFGYRPHRTRQQALARAEQLASGAGCWVWNTEDIKDAFTQVPQQRLLDVLRLHFPNEGILQLLTTVVVTRTGRGLRQGGNLSPLLMNVYLDHFLDRPWRKQHPQVPLIRVADDLLLLCRNRQEAEASYVALKQLLQVAGMPLKGTPSTALRELDKGQDAHWLGYRLLQANDRRLEAHIGEKSWHSLTEKLALAHTKPVPPLYAHEAVRGWVSQLGPCYPSVDHPRTFARLMALAKRFGFDELPAEEELLDLWKAAASQWEACRQLPEKTPVVNHTEDPEELRSSSRELPKYGETQPKTSPSSTDGNSRVWGIGNYQTPR